MIWYVFIKTLDASVSNIFIFWAPGRAVATRSLLALAPPQARGTNKGAQTIATSLAQY
jgi:hypothetical protein